MAVALGCVALSLWAYRSALHSFFSPDDLVLLERARGLRDAPFTIWRVIPTMVLDVVAPVFGSDPRPYLTINWALHGINVLLLLRWMTRCGMGLWASALAAVLFGTSRLFYSAVAQAAGLGELLAVTLTLAAFSILVTRGRRRVVLASLVFLGALLCKESVGLLPAALLLVPALGATIRERWRAVGPLLGVSAVGVGFMWFTGVAGGALGGPAYETALSSVLPNLARYALWSLDLSSPAPDFASLMRPAPPWMGPAALLVLGGILVVSRREPMVIAGLCGWILGLLPVLPLSFQRYLHYLYAPSVWLAIALGAFVAGRLAALTSGTRAMARVPPAVMIALLVAYVATSQHLMDRRLHDRHPSLDLPVDPFVHKIELIRRVSQRLRPIAERPGARLAVYIPRIQHANEAFAGLIPAAFDDGRGIRALYPQVDTALFVQRWHPELRDFDLVIGSIDGYVLPLGRGPEAHLAAARLLVSNGFPGEAIVHLTDAMATWPADDRLRQARADLVARGEAAQPTGAILPP